MTIMEGRVALVTGAAAGIGRATALAFAREGAKVVVSDIEVTGGEETAALIEKKGGETVYIKADISSRTDVQALIAGAIEAFGRIDCACNNAGTEGRIAPILEQTQENLERITAVNTFGTFFCLQAEIAHMLENGGGAIVNISSVAGLIGFPGISPYVASKHAVNGLTKNAALEYGKQGIRVNSICPGGIDTRMLDSLAEQSSAGQMTAHEMLGPMHPIGRIGRPEEVGEFIVWLCSDRASFVTGAIIPVDGGYVAQ